jgi:hypothetical protein
MILLGARLYDPAVAVNKVTTAALAMTALDTTNLRIAFTVPSHGFVRVRLSGTLHGATTFPSILLGVMNGASVVARVAPTQELGNTAVATALVKVTADFCIPGLTPGAATWDAAYGVETLVAATGLKYGGPNDSTANNAFGAFCFEVWDPNSVSSVTGSVGSVASPVTAGTVSDKTGYSLTQTFPVNFTTLSIDGTGKVTTTGGAGADPLNSSVPGVYVAGTAGHVLGNIADKVFGYTP